MSVKKARRNQGKAVGSADPHVHGTNLAQKEQHPKKYRDDESKKRLREIRTEYDKWHEANIQLIGPISLADESQARQIISERTQLFENYKKFLDQEQYATKFDSRSNLHSSALEEFMYYLFRDFVKNFSAQALLGKSHTFKDLFFVPSSYEMMLKKPGGMIETKDHDFVIGATVWATLTSTVSEIGREHLQQLSLMKNVPIEAERVYLDQAPDAVEDSSDAALAIQLPVLQDEKTELHRFDIPAVAIECKTYLDKTMLESSARAAEELKARNPNSLYIVVMERIKLTESVNLRKYKIDQIYILRKQRNKDREDRLQAGYDYKPIDEDVVWHLFRYVHDFLTRQWETGIDKGIERGYLLGD